MKKRFLIVGGVAGGASVAARLRRLGEDHEIIMLEKGPHVSFSNCCLPYHLSGTISKAESLVLMSPVRFQAQYNIEARVHSEVTSIDTSAKQVTVTNSETGETYTESYDKLFLSPGAKPIVPPIPGLEEAPYFTVRNVVDIDKLNKAANKKPNQKITIVGGGFIGVEVAENLKEAGHEITLVEAMDQILKIFDYDMAQILHKELHDKGVNLIVEDKLDSVTADKGILGSGKEIPHDLIVLAIGVTPDTILAKEAGLELSKRGAIQVDHNYRTSDPHIYAVGDAISVYTPLLQRYIPLPLAGPAQKQARFAADHAMGRNVDNRGYIGSSSIQVFDMNGASTGLTESAIKQHELSISYDTAVVIPGDKVGLMPQANPLHFKLIFEVPTGRILGAQAIGRGAVDKRIDVIATLIKMGGTVHDLKDLELCYAPPFSTAKDVSVMAGYVAVNLLHKEFKQVHAHQVRELITQGAYIIDVREPREYERSHIEGAVNIPLSQIRDRLSEIPKDKPVYLHCRSAQRSYNATLALQHHGYTEVYNISGGFLGISYYEYFNDITKQRKPIVTDYNFN